jgi:AcrR family transcriptional regulator
MSPKVKEEVRRDDEAWRGEPLPRGRHKLATEVVRASQRERLIRAMLETVAESGYEATTVPEVVARARVSRNAFYEFFADKTDCFIAACDEQATELLAALVAFGSEPDWVQMMRRGVGAYLHWWAERPAMSRAYFVGLPAAGDRAVAQRERAYGLFRGVFSEAGQRARSEQPGLPPLDEFVPRLLVLAITELVAEEVRAGRTERLPELEDRMVFTAIKLLADDETAGRALAI